MTDEQHNNYIGWAFVVNAGFQVFMALLMVFFMSMAFWSDPRGVPPPPFFGFIMAFALVFQLLFVIPSAIAAYGVWKRKKWARIASIVAGVMSAMNVPFGTAAAIYSLWFFLSDHWRNVYEHLGETSYSERAVSRVG